MEVTRRRWKYGSNALALCGAVFVALILSYGLLERHPWRWDTTANKEQSLSDQTKQVLSELKPEVTITAFFRRGEDIDDVYIRRKVDDILKEYALHSKKIHYQMVDPDVQVEQTLKDNITMDATVVFSAGNKRKDVTKSQLFDYANTAEEQMPSFLGEEAFTNALLSVTQGKQQTIYFLQGHGERLLQGQEPVNLTEIKRALENNNYLVRELSLVTTPKIPDDADLLIIAGPSKNIPPQEDQLIADFLKQGKLLLLLGTGSQGLEQTLQGLKVKAQHDIVLDPKRHFLLGAHYPSPVLEDHEITKGVQQTNPIFSMARSLEVTEKSQNRTPFLSTSPEAWGETNLTEGNEPKFNPGTDLKGPLTLGVAIQREHPLAVVVGDVDFVSNGLIQIPGNQDLFLNMVSWLSGEGAKLAIGPKKTDFRHLSASPGQARFVAYFTQAGYPLFVLVGGLVYWYRRKNR